MKIKLEIGDIISFRKGSLATQYNDGIIPDKKYKITYLEHNGHESNPYSVVRSVWISEIGNIKGTYYDPVNNKKAVDGSIIYHHGVVFTEELEI